MKEDALAERQKRENQAYMEKDGTILGALMDASGKSSSSSLGNAEAILNKHYGFDEATISRVKKDPRDAENTSCQMWRVPFSR